MLYKAEFAFEIDSFAESIDFFSAQQLAAYHSLQQELGNQNRCQNTDDNTDHQRHGKSSHRPGTQLVQNNARDHSRQLGVDDGSQSPFKSGIHRSPSAFTLAVFFSDSGKNDYIGIYRHTD